MHQKRTFVNIGRYCSSFILLMGSVIRASSPVSGSYAKQPELGCSTPSDACWEYGFHYPGVNGDVYALATDNAGNIYVGGDIYEAGGIEVNNIAKWDGLTWTSLGGITITSGTAYVDALAVDSSGNLYAGGWFDMAGTTPANNIAKWNVGTETWEALGSGTTGGVTTIEIVSGSTLFVGGLFSHAGGISVNNIAQFNGTTWSALGDGVGGTVYATAYDAVNDVLYVGGDFLNAGGVDATLIAMYTFDSGAWIEVGSGVTNGGTVYELLLVPGSGSAFDLYVGGAFNFLDKDGKTMVGIARWDGLYWNSMDTGAFGEVYAIEKPSSSNTIYIGGDFDEVGFGAGTLAALKVASWNGSSWSTLSPGLGEGYEEVQAILITDYGEVIAGGDFSGTGGLHFNNLALWDPTGSEWNGMDGGLGMYSVVNVLETHGPSIYAAGIISYAGLSFVGGLGELDGPAWTGFDGFQSSYVRDLATPDGTTLYVGGAFSDIVAVAADNLAVWNGSNWAEFGGGANSYVNAVAVDGSGNLYVGGEFTQVGPASLPADHIAMWNGAGWETLGDGLDGDVNDIVVDDFGNVYAAGDFLYAGDLYVGHIAKWDGAEWHSLDYGLRNIVMELELDDDGRLYAGGYFVSSFSGLTLNGIGMWNGTDWSALGSGMDDAVGALTIDINGDLYAGGDFETAGGIPANHIARWNGFSWSALGSGTDSNVFALTTDGTHIIAGGAFKRAGGKPSTYIGEYILPPAPPAPAPVLVSLSPNMAGKDGAGLWMSVSGSDFSSRSIVRWQSETLLTTYVNGTHLLVFIPADKLTLAGEFDITVFTPATSGGGSSITSLPFLVLGNHQYLPLLMR